MKKMHYLSSLDAPLTGTPSSGSGGALKLANLYDSHPPSVERYERLKKKAEQYNGEHHSHCHGLVRRMWAYVWSKSRKQIEADEAMENLSIAKQSQ